MNDAATTPETATLTVGDKTASFPVLRGTEGFPSVDIASFTKQTGHTALDYGFVDHIRESATDVVGGGGTESGTLPGTTPAN
mgnify:CR=1 FL=1